MLGMPTAESRLQFTRSKNLKQYQQLLRPERMTALVARELARYKVDIVTLNETRFPKQGQPEALGAGYTFFWIGRPKAE
ncbi:unnamed protein product [Schistocephalus solidus]|uniref:Endonuclease n=1 Tax=Schistocephalus solidus TaxID=70667 RepID=A0A183SZI7_SCHSO|nr:unnamed protein product [Schistocephalus solidus]